jgi:hypothetical protein
MEALFGFIVICLVWSMFRDKARRMGMLPQRRVHRRFYFWWHRR